MNNIQERIPISGKEFELVMAQICYENYKNEAIIEPNLRFYGNITPSTVDFKAEFDLFVYKRNGVVDLIELKARKVKEYDIYKFDVQAKRVGLIKSNLKVISTKDFDNKIKDLAFNLGVQLEKRDLKKSAKREGIDMRQYIKNIINKEEMSLYMRYNMAAIQEFPGYYILLNNCWIPQYSLKKAIIQRVKCAMKLSIPNTSSDKRKIMEFLYIKACVLEKWLIQANRKVLTQDIINLILFNLKNNSEKLPDRVKKFKEEIEKELGLKLEINDNLEQQRSKPGYVVSHEDLTKITKLYAIIGYDRYIIKSLSKIIQQFKKENESMETYLIHTTMEASKEAAKALQQDLSLFCPVNEPLNYLEIKKKNQFDLNDFICFINGLASSEAALLVSYIPKNWALLLHANRHKWKYFFFIDRPEDIQEKIELKAFELKY